MKSDFDFTDDSHPPSADELIAHNATYAAAFVQADLSAVPRRRLAVVACMDARVDVTAILGLDLGDVHTIRNAGGVVTDDVIRSLVLSQRALDTREIILIHHTDCGLAGVDETALRRELVAEVGVTPSWSAEAFDDPYDDVRQSMNRLHLDPFITFDQNIRGFVYNVATGALEEVHR